jgi:hypothetical protein
LFIAGDQVPLIPSREVVGNGAEVPPAQIGGAGLKVGTGKTILTVVLLTAPGQPKN